jgi:hypothetical protein
MTARNVQSRITKLEGSHVKSLARQRIGGPTSSAQANKITAAASTQASTSTSLDLTTMHLSQQCRR